MKPRIILPLLLLAFVCLSCNQNQVPERPNIIIINVDDMGWRDTGFMGSDYYETPNIDALAARGMIFTNGYASAANCAPSRACMMTGKWTPRHGIYTVASSERGQSKDRKLIPVENTMTLAQEHLTIPEALKQNGYITCHAGKWHLSENPMDFGFDMNIGGSHAGMPASYYPPYKNVHLNHHDDLYLTDAIMENIIDFIDTVKLPFYLNYAPYAVHTPIQAIDSLLSYYQEKPGSNGQGNPKYATMINNLDRNIGMLISSLEQKGLFDNTLLIFTSDNGGLYGITQQQPLRAGKGSYYEGGIREPFFFVFKDRISANTTSNVPITNIDIFPTIMDLVGLSEPSVDLDGASLLPVLEEADSKFNRHLYWHFPVYLQAYNVRFNENRDSLFRTRPGSVIRSGKWKLHYYFEDQGVELYNLEEDIGELNNLAETESAKAEELFTYLTIWWEETGAPIPDVLNPEYEPVQ